MLDALLTAAEKGVVEGLVQVGSAPRFGLPDLRGRLVGLFASRNVAINHEQPYR